MSSKLSPGTDLDIHPHGQEPGQAQLADLGVGQCHSVGWQQSKDGN